MQTGNTQLVHAAADVMAANAEDVAGNMLGIGDDPPDSGSGIPDVVDPIAVAGTVFNDATAKLIGGVYDGNRQSVHDDLVATQQGFASVLETGELTGRSAAHAQKVVDLIGRELALIDNVDAGPGSAAQINRLHSKIIDVVQGDKQLAALASADDANGFMALPAAGGNFGQGPGRGHGGGNGWGHDRGPCNTDAVAAAKADVMAASISEPDPMAGIFSGNDLHHAT
ncbi:MAG: hypothetical protein R3D67_03620 [Hyphomicrobiaceae bacterium]